MMMGLAGSPEQEDRKLIPKERHGVKTMSIGYLIEDEKPVVWRGPMVHKLIEQFLGDVAWGELDYLLVDMPPGTGDAQLSLAQIVPLTGTVLVTTPQAVSTYDVAKAIAMFKQVQVEILGIVENMAGFAIQGQVEGAGAGTKVNVDTGARKLALTTDESGRFRAVVNVFGAGGAEMLAKKHGFPVLGQIPLDPGVRVGGDAGGPDHRGRARLGPRGGLREHRGQDRPTRGHQGPPSAADPAVARAHPAAGCRPVRIGSSRPVGNVTAPRRDVAGRSFA